MGEFADAGAVRAEPVEVARAIAGFAAAHGVGVDLLWDADADAAEVACYPSPGGWTVLEWAAGSPMVAAVRHVSAELETLACTVSIYDGDFWTQVVFERGRELDRFASVPDYFEADRRRAGELRRLWAGRPDVLALAFDRDEAHIRPYLVHDDGDEDVVYAFPDDRFEVGVPWVYIDLWRRLGITVPGRPYPEPPASAVVGLDLGPGWERRLPSNGQWHVG